MSSAASVSASAEEGGRGAHSKSERTPNWGSWPPESVSSRQAQSTQPYSIQSANRGPSSWADWARKLEIRSQSIEFPAPTPGGMRQPAALTAGDGIGTLSHQVGQDHLGGLSNCRESWIRL